MVYRPTISLIFLPLKKWILIFSPWMWKRFRDSLLANRIWRKWWETYSESRLLKDCSAHLVGAFSLDCTHFLFSLSLLFSQEFQIFRLKSQEEISNNCYACLKKPPRRPGRENFLKESQSHSEKEKRGKEKDNCQQIVLPHNFFGSLVKCKGEVFAPLDWLCATVWKVHI